MNQKNNKKLIGGIMGQSFNFSAETPEEITEKVAAVMKGFTKTADSGLVQSLKRKKAFKPAVEFIVKIGRLGLTIKEVEFLCNGIKGTIKNSTIFLNK